MRLHEPIPFASDQGWKAMCVRGVAALLFGMIALIFPSLGLTALLLIFAAYLVIDAVFVLTLARRAVHDRHRLWPYALEGFADLALATAILIAPETMVLWFVYLIAIWAVATGLIAASPLMLSPESAAGMMFLALYALLSVAWGCALLLFPSTGAVLVWWLAIYALLVGIVLLAEGLGQRSAELQP
jgi:uncharacterized membrane protein HdeD (DUF308 family)